VDVERAGRFGAGRNAELTGCTAERSAGTGYASGPGRNLIRPLISPRHTVVAWGAFAFTQ
jgi:hypothetical protein